MLLSKENIINSLFICDNDGFITNAIQFFYYLGHTSSKNIEEIYNNPRYGMLEEVAHDIKFTTDENTDVAKIIGFAKLFKINSNEFDNANSLPIKYYAINIIGIESNRMKIARSIHKLLARGMDAYSIILFKWYNHIMLSATCLSENNKKIVISSDWLSQDSDDRLINSLFIENLSMKKSDEFLADFAFSIAPQYYSHPTESYDRYYSVNNIEEFFMDGNLDREELHNYVGNVLNKAVTLYGDDYVEYKDSITVSKDVNTINLDDELALIAIDGDFGILEEEYLEDTSIEEYKNDSIDKNSFDMAMLKDKSRLLDYLDDDY